jgi:GDPmannose 4,6-dehydratase
MTAVLITGASGQDGYYLAELLAARGKEVWGLTRNGGSSSDHPLVRPTAPADIRDQVALDGVLATVAPSAVFHLAAQSSVSASWDDPVGTAEVTGVGTARLLDAVHRIVPTARVFVASSSEIFGHPDDVPQKENTRIQPVSPYGAAKAYAHYIASSFRERHGMFVATGILYNHESPRRRLGFVTQKIARGAVAVARGEQERVVLGNLESRRDWGYAGDVVRAMALMTLDTDEPGDYVVATGESHAVREWCEIAFRRVGLNWMDHVVTAAALSRPDEPAELVGDPSKAMNRLGWRPTLSFADLVNLMVDSELERLERDLGTGALRSHGR